MFCPQCSEKIDSKAVFCPNCGAKIAGLRLKKLNLFILLRGKNYYRLLK